MQQEQFTDGARSRLRRYGGCAPARCRGAPVYGVIFDYCRITQGHGNPLRNGNYTLYGRANKLARVKAHRTEALEHSSFDGERNLFCWKFNGCCKLPAIRRKTGDVGRVVQTLTQVSCVANFYKTRTRILATTCNVESGYNAAFRHYSGN
jgi:hypothetical protein